MIRLAECIARGAWWKAVLFRNDAKLAMGRRQDSGVDRQAILFRDGHPEDEVQAEAPRKIASPMADRPAESFARPSPDRGCIGGEIRQREKLWQDNEFRTRTGRPQHGIFRLLQHRQDVVACRTDGDGGKCQHRATGFPARRKRDPPRLQATR